MLIAADQYPAERYGLDTRVALPRLQLLVPAEATTLLDEHWEDLQFATQLAAALILGAILSAALVVAHPIWLLLPAITLVLAWLAYRNALTAGVQYGEALRVLFDLYRFRLYDALREPSPMTPDEERDLGRRISLRLWRGFEDATG